MANKTRKTGQGGLSGLIFIGWVTYGIMIMVSPGVLDDIWDWVGDTDLWLKIVVWILTLPWMVGLAIRESSWEPWVRTTAVWVIAIAWIIILTPKTYRRS